MSTENEYAGLSDEERAAIEDDDDETVEDEPEEDEPEEDEAEEVAESPEPEPVKQEPFVPVYQADPVADYDARLAEITERKKTLRTQYQDGEMEMDAYEDARDHIDGDLLALREANLKATMAVEQEQQVAKQRWAWEQDRFFAAKETAVYRQDPILGTAFDAAVKGLAANPKHQNQPMAWFLEEADRLTRDSMRKVTGAAATMKASGKAKPRANIPPNLGDMPSAELPEANGNEWSHLDRLEGMALESALMKMSVSEQERYLTH